MKPTAHAPSQCLAAYAGGALPAGMSLLVASHLTYCPSCRARVERLEALGGALIAEEPGVEPDPGCLARCLAQIDAPDAPPAPVCACREIALPQPLRQRLGPDVAAIPWQAVRPGLAVHRLPGFAGEDVRLVRADPGATLCDGPATPEAMLVLGGRLRDGAQVHGPGDVALSATGGVCESVGAAACTCLVVSRGSRPCV